MKKENVRRVYVCLITLNGNAYDSSDSYSSHMGPTNGLP